METPIYTDFSHKLLVFGMPPSKRSRPSDLIALQRHITQPGPRMRGSMAGFQVARGFGASIQDLGFIDTQQNAVHSASNTGDAKNVKIQHHWCCRMTLQVIEVGPLLTMHLWRTKWLSNWLGKISQVAKYETTSWEWKDVETTDWRTINHQTSHKKYPYPVSLYRLGNGSPYHWLQYHIPQ